MAYLRAEIGVSDSVGLPGYSPQHKMEATGITDDNDRYGKQLEADGSGRCGVI